MSYDGRRFRSGAAETAAGHDGPIGHYHQSGDLVWAEFSGGSVRHWRRTDGSEGVSWIEEPAEDG